MQYSDVAIGAKVLKHLGNYVIAVDHYNMVTAYKITKYVKYEPVELERVAYTKITNVMHNNQFNWDTAYNYLIGAPTQPNFTKALNV